MAFARIAVLMLAVGLAGCNSSPRAGILAGPSIPVLPGDLAQDCRDPGVRAGQPVINELVRNRQALSECRRRHADTVVFYDTMRANLTSR